MACGDLVGLTVLALGVDIDDEDIVLLGCTTFPIIGGGDLELNTLKGDNGMIGSNGTEADITTWTNGLGHWDGLRTLITLWGMLDEINGLFPGGDPGSDTQGELGDREPDTVNVDKVGGIGFGGGEGTVGGSHTESSGELKVIPSITSPLTIGDKEAPIDLDMDTQGQIDGVIGGGDGMKLLGSGEEGTHFIGTKAKAIGSTSTKVTTGGGGGRGGGACQTQGTMGT